MTDLKKLQEFAAEQGFGLTSPLGHGQVVPLAEYWFPEMRFHEEEKFHPISLDEYFSRVEDIFARLPETAKDRWRVELIALSGTKSPPLRAFDPPVVHVPGGAVQIAGQTLYAVRVLSEEEPARDALAEPAADDSAVITHGASFTRSNEFFGAAATVAGGAEASAGDPFLPRATDDQGRPLVTVMASLMNLIDLLKYELIVWGAEDYPPDGLRGGFDVLGSLLHASVPQPLPLPAATIRSFLLGMIAAVESGGEAPEPPFGWELDRTAWDAVTRFAFLEYDFFYAYDDFNRYQTAIFDNEHEADAEGCCLVFERNALNVAASADDPDALLRVVPHSVITSVHDEDQDADIFKFIEPPAPSENRLARDDAAFTVYVAGGSHATYLTPGDHDLVDFQDYLTKLSEHPLATLLLALTLPYELIALLIALAILEHFIDTKDFTSDDGVRAGPESVVDPSLPTVVAHRLIVLPMSADNHIYAPENEGILRLRAFAGRWGGHDGIIDHSPTFRPKTGRYFRKLLSQL